MLLIAQKQHLLYTVQPVGPQLKGLQQSRIRLLKPTNQSILYSQLNGHINHLKWKVPHVTPLSDTTSTLWAHQTASCASFTTRVPALLSPYILHGCYWATRASAFKFLLVMFSSQLLFRSYVSGRTETYMVVMRATASCPACCCGKGMQDTSKILIKHNVF